MANYFQTDDRDDYLSKFSSDKPTKIKPLYNITFNGQLVLSSIYGHKGVTFCKTMVNKTRKILGGCWKEELKKLGYVTTKIN